MIKRIALALAGLVLLLVLAVAANTARQGSRQLDVPPAPQLAVDERALADKLAGAVRFQTIASLDDISVIKLDFAVPEAYLSALAPGQAISARSAAWPDREFTGEVRTVDSRVDPVTRAVTVRAELPNPDRQLRPGMLLTLRIFQPERQALVSRQAAGRARVKTAPPPTAGR